MVFVDNKGALKRTQIRKLDEQYNCCREEWIEDKESIQPTYIMLLLSFVESTFTSNRKKSTTVEKENHKNHQTSRQQHQKTLNRSFPSKNLTTSS